MRRMAEGDTDALSQLLLRHQALVLRVASRLLNGDNASAEDVAQEVFLKVWRRAAEYASQGVFTAYLLRITRNYCHDLRRRARRDCPLSEASRYTVSDEEKRAAQRTAAAFRSALATLPDEQRDVFVLSHFEGRSYREIAAILNCPMGTVASRKYLAVKGLRERMKDDE